MANIYSYPQIGELADTDNLIISDAGNGNRTKSVTIGQLSDYFGTSGGGVDNYVNGGSYSSGALTLTRTGSLPDINISGFSTGGDSVYSKLETFINFQELLFFDGQSSFAREIELVAAPGANKLIIIDSVFAYMQPGTTAFDFNTALSIGLSGQENNGFLSTVTIQSGVLNTSIGSAVNFIAVANSSAPFPETAPPGYNYTNKGIVLTNPFATTVTQGNSTLKLNIVYRIVNI
jgi:hypothetical protein